MIGDRNVNVFYDEIMLGHNPEVDLPFMPRPSSAVRRF